MNEPNIPFFMTKEYREEQEKLEREITRQKREAAKWRKRQKLEYQLTVVAMVMSLIMAICVWIAVIAY